MLVFRCECEQVLGVDDESTKGGLGECPTCGRIIRVPKGLVSAAGKLRLAGPPVRAGSTSGAFRQIPEGVRNGSATTAAHARPPIVNGTASKSAQALPAVPPSPLADTLPMSAAMPALAPLPPVVVPAEIAVNEGAATAEVPVVSETAEITAPEVDLLADARAEAPPPPNSSVEIGNPTETATQSPPPEELAAEVAAVTVSMDSPANDPRAETTEPTPSATGVKPTKSVPVKPNAGSARKGVIAKKGAIKPTKFTPAKVDANDPNAALETKNDRNIAAVANAAAKRGKPAAAASGTDTPAPAKKNFMIIYMVAMIAIAVIAGVCYALGVFTPEPAKTNTPVKAPAVKKDTKPATTPENTVAAPPSDVKPDDKKPEDPATPATPKPADAPDAKTPADPAKVPADPAKPPADPEKKEEKKDPAAEVKLEDKKEEKKDPAATDAKPEVK